MRMIRTNVKINTQSLEQNLKKRTQKGQVVLDTQVLKDSNFYAPQDTGELIRSAIRMSLIGQGVIMWVTPYARRLYYNPQYNFSKSPNPNAQGLWFEVAKANHLFEWLDRVAREMGGRVKR